MYHHQDWEQVVIHSTKNKKESAVKKQNAAGTKEFHMLNDDDIPVLDKITPTQSKNLQEARASKKIKQDELAKMLNMNVSVIKEYENGTVAKFNKRLYNNMMKRLGVSS